MSPNVSAMENGTAVNGVFLHTKLLDSEMMVRCLQAMLNNFPAVKFTSVLADEKFLGYRVHFSRPDEESVLAKKVLPVSGEDIRICELTTCLTIHSLQSNGGAQLESDIRDAIQSRFGKLLDIVKIPGSPSRQNENTTNWRAYVDIPEIRELKIFDHEGFPEMCMWLPNKKEKLKVTFCCRHCKNDGHVKQDCLQVVQPKASVAEERLLSNDDERVSSGSAVTFKIPLESTETYAEKIGREEIMKAGILTEGNPLVKGAETSESAPEARESEQNKPIDFTLSLNNIKKEVEENNNDCEKKYKRDRNSEDHGNARVPKTEPPNAFGDIQDSDSNSHFEDEIQFIEEKRDSSSSSSIHRNISSMLDRRVGAANSDEELPSPPARPVDHTFSPTFSSAPGPSNATYGGTRPVIAVEVTSLLSPRLQDCINIACVEVGILDRKKLDAFLTHVKKKSNPIRVASNYTPHAARLKDQLQHILDMYYNTPQTGTKEDIQFIKWLNGLVARFEGTVSRKRKRGGSHDDTPSKKY